MKLIDAIKENINSAGFTEVWNFILQIFGDNTELNRRRIKFVLCVLQTIEEQDVPVSRTKAVISRLILDITKFKSEDLAKMCKFCLECIQSRKTTKMGWKDLLPEVLNVLMDREIFEFEDLNYTGQEYKTSFIDSLCLSSWSPNIVTILASAFIDMHLTKEELFKITYKLGTYIEKLTPQELPSFVYQLLRLCKQDSARSVFVKLQNYFGLRIYNSSTEISSASANSMDLIESADNQETIEAEGTVLYHIHTAAALSHDCIVNYLNSLKNMTKTPEFILHPFQLMLLFTISTVSHYEENVFEILRPCIVKSYQEEQKKEHSDWYKDMVPVAGKPEEVFDKVIHYSIEDRELMLQALVNFGFVLLGVGAALGRDVLAEKQWHLGNMILLKIIKRKQHTAMTIIQTLCNNIITRQSATQYIECLYILSRSLPLLILESQSCIVELMDSLMQIPGSTANQLLDALIPITKVSPSLRDHLIMLLKKALYSSSVETRQMAVSGFLKLITHLKISNMTSLSQSNSSSFSSGHSVFTQLSLNKSTQAVGPNTFCNEALCLEVLSILKRCFMQQIEVKTQLYDGLFDAISINLELAMPTLEVIWFHFKDFYVADENEMLPVDFKKISILRDTDSVQMEPLGKLVYTIGLILNNLIESDEQNENVTVVKYADIMESVCDRMKNCELVHFELDDGTDLLDILPEAQRKLQILQEAISVYEALIGYKINTWNEHSENQARTVYALFQGYSRLEQFAKTLSKPKKAEAKKKRDMNKSTQQSHNNTTATCKKDGQKPRTFRSPKTVLDFQCIKKFLSLLHEPNVPWTTTSEANLLKTKKELHQKVMHTTFTLVQNAKKLKVIDTQIKKNYYEHISDIAAIIFRRIVKRLVDFLDFDSATAVLAMDCFHNILSLISTQYKSNVKSFLKKIVDEADKDKDTIRQLTVMFEVCKKIFEEDDAETSDDADTRNISLTVINTIGVLAGLVPNDGNVVSIKIFDWLKHFAYNKIASAKVSTAFINLFFELHLKYKPSLTILEQMSVSIGDIVGFLTEEDHVTSEKFKLINEASVNSVFLALCANVKTTLDDIDSVVARLKSECSILLLPGIDNVESRKERLKIKEKGVCCHLCFVITIMTNLSNLALQPGNMTEAVFKNIISLFNTLSSLTKYFTSRSSKTNLPFQGARYERLVKLAGKQLAPAVYKFIIHLEDAQTQENKKMVSKKKSDALKSKVLRETRLIPKAVYEMEQFSRCVIQLSNKTKVDLTKHVGQGTVRDFRIMKLQEVLEQIEEQPGDRTASTQNEENDEEESANLEEEIAESDSDNDNPPPPSKKSRT
ncbi:unnamed protein product [Acanthoscelides obtectus]|uniref:Fanconi anemia group I protein n=1 Tax=Acanthoscelides obtectus TaxID=200917 RepID=A0A9P0M980_ACAOB|nr:unnamed protein product [Acanthoscelides obtectus]CAK1663635.1 Fanconi anemia group I protein homolog [Acanthoscelides obtectus]